jgi:hypothetical protein
LGEGIYFWEGSSQRAWGWALEKYPKEAAVLGAVISLGHCLDLLEQDCLDYVHQTFAALKAEADKQGKALPANKKDKRHALDCAIINAAVRGYEPEYDSVRAAFHEGDPIAALSGIHQQSHIQIAIHNPNCIKAFFYPREGSLTHPGV